MTQAVLLYAETFLRAQEHVPKCNMAHERCHGKLVVQLARWRIAKLSLQSYIANVCTLHLCIGQCCGTPFGHEFARNRSRHRNPVSKQGNAFGTLAGSVKTR